LQHDPLGDLCDRHQDAHTLRSAASRTAARSASGADPAAYSSLVGSVEANRLTAVRARQASRAVLDPQPLSPRGERQTTARTDQIKRLEMIELALV
jgi:hypothetical protein